MSASSSRPRRRTVVLLAILLLPVLVWLLRNPLVHPLLAKLAARHAERSWGAELTIDRIRGNWFTNLRVEGLHLSVPEGRAPVGGLRVLEVGSLTLEHSFGHLVALRGAGVRAELDLRGEGGAEQDRGGSAGPGAPPGRLPALDLRDVSLRARLPAGWTAEIEGLDLSASDATDDARGGAPGPQAVRASATALRVGSARGAPVGGPLAAELTWRAGHVGVDRLELGTARVTPGGSVDLGPTLADVRWTLELAGSGAMLATDGGLADGRLDARVDGSDLPLAGPLSWLDRAWGEAVAGDVSLVADVAGDLGDLASLSGSLELQGGTFALGADAAFVVDSVSGSAELGADGLSIPRLELLARSGALRLADARVPLPLGAEGEPVVAGRLELETEHLRRFLANVEGDPRVANRTQLAAVFAPDGARIEGGLTLPGGRVVVDRGTLTLAGGPDDPGFRADLDIEASADLEDLAPIGELLGSAPWAGSARIALGISGRWPDLSLSFEGDGGGVLIAGHPLGAAALQGVADLPVDRLEDTEGSATFRCGPAELGGLRFETLRGALAAHAGVISAPELVLEQEGNRIEVRDARGPRTLDPVTFLAEASGRVEAEIRDLPALSGRVAAAAAQLPEHRLALVARVGGGRATIEEGVLETIGGTATVRSGELRAVSVDRGETGGPPAVAVDLEIESDFADLSPLGPILGPIVGPGDWAGSLAGSVAVEGRWPALDATADLTGSGLVAAGLPLGELAVRASLERDRVHVERLQLRRGDDDLVASGSVDWRDGRFEDVELALAVADLAPWSPGPLAAGGVRVEGRVGGRFPLLSGELELEAGRLAWGAHALRDVRARATAEDGRYAVEELAATTDAGELAASGDLALPGDGSWTARLASLVLRDERGALTLASPVDAEGGPGRLRVSPVELAGPAGRLSGHVERDGEVWSARASAADFDPSPLLAIPPGGGLGLGALTFDLELERDASRTVLRSDGRAHGITGFAWRQDDAPELDAEWDLALEDGRLRIARARLDLDGEGELWVSGEAPLTPFRTERFPEGELDLEAGLRLDRLAALPLPAAAAAAPPVDGALRAQADLSGTWRALQGTLQVDAERVALAEVDRTGTLTARAELGTEGLAIREARLEIPERLRASAAGSLALPPDVTRWMARDARPELTGDLDLRLDVADLSWVAPRLEAIRRLAGSASGRVHLTGPLAKPDLEGHLELRRGEIKLASEFPAAGDVSLDVALEQRLVRIESMTGELGGAPFRLEGSASFAGDETELDLDLAGENLLLRRERGLVVRADTELAIEGPVSALRASGELRLRNPRLTKDVELLRFDSGSLPSTPGRGLRLFSFTRPPLSRATFDVRVTTEEPFQIRNNLMRGAVRPDLRLTGTGEVPRFKGTIYVDPTVVLLPASRVQVESGTIVFTSADASVPELQLAGSARKFGYDVALVVTGPYDDPRVQLSSTPPLPTDDILLLLLAGQLPQASGDAEASPDAGQAVAIYVAQDLVSDWLSEKRFEEDEESFFDRLEVTTGRDVSESGLPTIEISFRLADEVFRRRDRLLLAMERDDYDHYNLGLRLVFRLR